jgi:hypothetical protein
MEPAASDRLQVAQAEPVPPAAAADDDLATLAQKTNNPISDAWLLITQNDTTLIGGDVVDGTKVSNVLKFQPVLSAPMFDDSWNFVVRPVFQFASQPLDDDAGQLIGAAPNDIAVDANLARIADDPSGRTTGLGDTVLLTLVGPNSDSGWIFAAGASQIFPTASEDVLGQGKWQAGPAALVARLGKDYGGFGIEHFNFVQLWAASSTMVVLRGRWQAQKHEPGGHSVFFELEGQCDLARRHDAQYQHQLEG